MRQLLARTMFLRSASVRWAGRASPRVWASASRPGVAAARWAHDHTHDHGHSHEHMEHPGEFGLRETGHHEAWAHRDWASRAFTVGIGGPVGSGKVRRTEQQALSPGGSSRVDGRCCAGDYCLESLDRRSLCASMPSCASPTGDGCGVVCAGVRVGW